MVAVAEAAASTRYSNAFDGRETRSISTGSYGVFSLLLHRVRRVVKGVGVCGFLLEAAIWNTDKGQDSPTPTHRKPSHAQPPTHGGGACSPWEKAVCICVIILKIYIGWVV